jgi:hypothetical protein
VLFGLSLVISTVRFLALGWVHEQYVAPRVHFPYLGFAWVGPLPEPLMTATFIMMAISALGVMLGAWYRASAIMLFITFTYVELIDKTYYLNHYYFVSIMAFVLAILPAHGAWSVDARRNRVRSIATVPRWMLAVVKIQISIVYVYAGIAKMTPHWLFDAMPLRIWLPAHDTMPLIGWMFAIPWMPWVMSWAGMIYDCTIPLFLLWRTSRPWAYVAVVVFHVVTGAMFQIGVFPLVMILTTLVFFSDTSHERALNTVLPWLRSRVQTAREWQSRWANVLAAVLITHVVVQILVPFRFLLYPGNLYWTEEGYRFSWRVMLVEKAGTATFTVHDPDSGRSGVVANSDWLNSHQEKQMSFQPDMILQFAHILRDYYTTPDGRVPRVTADVWVTMNGAASRQLIDPNRDLGAEREGFHHYDWVLPWE